MFGGVTLKYRAHFHPPTGETVLLRLEDVVHETAEKLGLPSDEVQVPTLLVGTPPVGKYSPMFSFLTMSDHF